MSENIKQGKSSLMVIFLLSAALLVSLYFNFRQNKSLTDAENRVILIQNQCDTIAFRKLELEKEVSVITEDLNRFKGRSEELDKLLTEANEKIERQKKEISRLIEQNKDYNVLKARYADLRRLKDQYLAQIDSLVAENKKLRFENTELAVKVDKLRDEKGELAEKITLASGLKVKNLRIAPLQVKASGRIKEVEKASRADRLNIKFTIQENALAKHGPKTAFVRILSPQGFVMTDISESMRKFKIKNGREIPFSRSVNFEYLGKELTLEADYDQEVFTPGNYKVEVYIDDEFAGSEQITLQ